jgi:hypothetical protein
VVLWSKEKWEDVDCLGSDKLPGKRFVSGVTQGIRVVGVCIPYDLSRYNKEKEDGSKIKQWDDHLAYLNIFEPLIQRYYSDKLPVCLTGDYNQRIPRVKGEERIDVSERLNEILSNAGLQVITRSLKVKPLKGEEKKQIIDHVATCRQLKAEVLKDKFISNKWMDINLSDGVHVGVVTSITSISG